MSTSRKTTDLNADEVIRYLGLLRRLDEVARLAPDASAPLHLRLARARRLRTWSVTTAEEFRADLLALSRDVGQVEETLSADPDPDALRPDEGSPTRNADVRGADPAGR